MATGYTRADAIASLVVVGLMLQGGLGAAARLRPRAAGGRARGHGPRIRSARHLLETAHVSDMHDLHAWTVTSGLPALSAHVVIDDSCFTDGHAPRLLDQLQACLAGHFDVEHSTFQLETAAHVGHETGTH